VLFYEVFFCCCLEHFCWATQG